jgi:signal peptidase I
MKLRKIIQQNRSFFTGLAIIFIVRGSFADQNIVPSGSMEPTIQIGDHIYVNRAAYDLKFPFSEYTLVSLNDPQPGDIIVFHNPQTDVRMVKRLIGLPGDRIHVRNGLITINGKPIEGSEIGAKLLAESADDEINYQERMGKHLATIKRTQSMFRPDDLEIVVPAGQYFAMGDNRDNSYDSRGWGTIPRSKIVGKAEAVIFNVSWNPLPEMKLERIGQKLM